MAGKPKICIIGSLNIDFVTSTPRIPGPGETLTATSMTVHPGGKGANQAVACGKAAFTAPGSQDVAVEMFGAVGADDPYYSSLLKPTLEKSGVSTAGIEQVVGTGGQTGTATILVDEGSSGENRILVVPGANATVTDAKAVRDAVMEHQVPDVVVMQGEIPRKTVLELLEMFNSSDLQTCVVFNPAPMFPDGITLEALKSLAVLVVNETECRQLFASSKGLDSGKVSGDEDESMDVAELEQLTTSLHEKAKISIILVTLGARGAYFSHSTGTAGVKDKGLISAAKVDRVVDTTAAGDSFVGYFASALARHLAHTTSLDDFNVKQAATNANQAAAKCVQRRGAMESIPWGYE
ncbi:ribokinase [Cladophialophora carrionii CBS 160.54]|uniref:Ribokinase n=1 Tax=Cladophialophora carrionii CBS 160.54 TaxID=1279043 RepID=V9DDR4_9EURO|nr:ribokinase [Cladophialophora carrionii CBS 160.54]ETI24458.1 ribokinase [Cladophialophora carrionii CBS 160.54]